MPHVRRSRFRPSVGSSRRKVSWSAGPSQIDTVALTGAGATIWSAGSQALLDDLTLVRVRGEYTIVQTLATNVGDGYDQIGLGMCIVSENAFGVGITAVPHPIADLSWDGWLWHNLLSSFRGASTTEVGRAPMEAVRGEIDSKAMRKTHQSDVLIGVIELGTEVGTANLQFGAVSRVLDKLA